MTNKTTAINFQNQKNEFENNHNMTSGFAKIGGS